MTHYRTANVFGLRPLDRVQVFSKAVIREIAFCRQMGQEEHPPFWFFQFFADDGHLVLRSPSGNTMHVSPADICDILPNKHGPVMTRAMPKAEWLVRQTLTLAERQQPPPSHSYADAAVMYAHKNGRLLVEFCVRFLDPSLNAASDGVTRFAPLADGERPRLTKLARRSLMPVQARTGGNWSADNGVLATESKIRVKAKSFFQAALAGKLDIARDLAACDAVPAR